MSNRNTTTDVHDELAALKSDLVDVRNDLKHMASALAENGKEKANAVAEQVMDKARTSEQAVRQQVEERPFTALAGAFGVGLLAGVILRTAK